MRKTKIKLTALLVVAGLICTVISLNAQFNRVAMDREYIISLTSRWDGERLPDGRPYVSDELLERLKNLTFTHAWHGLRDNRFNNQYQGDWMMVKPDRDNVMTGRVVTAQYMPSRPDFGEVIRNVGLAEGHARAGGSNSWPIDMLIDGDVYVADTYGKIEWGPIVGDRLASSILDKSGNGAVIWGSVRNIQVLEQIDGFNAWVVGHDLSWTQEMMLTSINAPIRIGKVTVLPGDIVLAGRSGTLFFPAYLVQEIVFNAEIDNLRHQYGIIRLRAGDWGTGQIDSRYTDEMNRDFHNWLNNLPDSELPMPRAELNEYLKDR